MLDKLKAFLTLIKGYALYIGAPLILLLGYIYSLLHKVQTLQDALDETKVEKNLAETLAKKVEATNEADKSETDYNTIRDEYIKQHPSDKP